MEYNVGEIGLKIKSTPSVAKTISIIRKYNPVSMAEIKSAIEENRYIITCSYISHPGVRIIRKCYDELTKNGATVEIYEHNRISSREFISNLINSHYHTEREVADQIKKEVAEAGEE